MDYAGHVTEHRGLHDRKLKDWLWCAQHALYLQRGAPAVMARLATLQSILGILVSLPCHLYFACQCRYQGVPVDALCLCLARFYPVPGALQPTEVPGMRFASDGVRSLILLKVVPVDTACLALQEIRSPAAD
eukprot:1160074-Pelagomonas_calceolata.AAC.3